MKGKKPFRSSFELRRVSPFEVHHCTELNPRKTIPSEQLETQIGFCDEIIEPVLTYESPDGNGYLTPNGWQRVQAARKAGIEEIPIRVYPDSDSAEDAAIISIVETPESDFHQWQRFRTRCVRRMENHRFTEKRAITDTCELFGFSKLAGQRRFDIFKLPPEVLAMAKEKDYRTKDEREFLEKRIPGLSRRSKTLGLADGAHMANCLLGRSIDELLLVVDICFDLDRKKRSVFIDRVGEIPNMCPMEILLEFEPDKVSFTFLLSKSLVEKLNRVAGITFTDLEKMIRYCLEKIVKDSQIN